MLTAAQPHLKLSDAAVGLLAGVNGAAVLRYDLPLERTGQSSPRAEGEADYRPGNLRVRILEVEGLPTRPDGSPCQPTVVVTVSELTRRRSRRISPDGAGPSVSLDKSFDFEETSASAQVVVDVWDQSADGVKSDLLGKAVIGLAECREGVPHTFMKNLLEGKLVMCPASLPTVATATAATTSPATIAATTNTTLTTPTATSCVINTWSHFPTGRHHLMPHCVISCSPHSALFRCRSCAFYSALPTCLHRMWIKETSRLRSRRTNRREPQDSGSTIQYL